MSDAFISFNGKKYAIDINKVKGYCITSSKEKARDVEVTNTYEPDDNGDIKLVEKVDHEIKSSANPQNDAIIWELIKMFIMTLLNNGIPIPEEVEIDYATAIAFNTLLHAGILIEIE